jgi:hypothetical protein
MSADLAIAAQCFGLFVEGNLAAFVGVLHRPHKTVLDIKAISRIVTLPDYQGLGLAMRLADTMGAAWGAFGYRLRNYPAHPAFIRSHDRSKNWALIKKPGNFSPTLGATSTMRRENRAADPQGGAYADWNMGGRPCAVFEYAGPKMERPTAVSLLGRTEDAKRRRPS